MPVELKGQLIQLFLNALLNGVFVAIIYNSGNCRL